MKNTKTAASVLKCETCGRATLAIAQREVKDTPNGVVTVCACGAALSGLVMGDIKTLRLTHELGPTPCPACRKPARKYFDIHLAAIHCENCGAWRELTENEI